jgi:hypothetical protein
VDKGTSGSTAHLGLTYYYYPVANCTAANCQLSVGFVSSANGGNTWSGPTALAGPMTLSWLPDTSQGRMVGDYTSGSFAGGSVHGAFAVAAAPTGSVVDCFNASPSCNQPTYTTTSGLTVSGGALAVTPADQQVPNAASDHAAPQSAIRRR